MLGFGRTVLPTNYVKVWAYGFAQQEGRTGEGIPGVVVVLVAGQGVECRSRTAATVAATPGLQRTDAAPELVATREDARPPGGGRPSAVSSPGWSAARGWRRSAAG